MTEDYFKIPNTLEIPSLRFNQEDITPIEGVRDDEDSDIIFFWGVLNTEAIISIKRENLAKFKEFLDTLFTI